MIREQRTAPSSSPLCFEVQSTVFSGDAVWALDRAQLEPRRCVVMLLEELGSRICIMGPSNSGKSTLAQAISRTRGLEVVHLDQLYHLPNTDWIARPAEEFGALHHSAIMGSRWVIEGNYSRLLLHRLSRATGFILLDAPLVVSLCRYVLRCWFERDRPGALEGGIDSVKWSMIHHIAVVTPAHRVRYRRVFDEVRLPKIRLDSIEVINRFYRSNGLGWSNNGADQK